MADFANILERSRNGDPEARSTVAELLRVDLRQLARRQLAGKRWMSTLDTTVLLSEAYLRLASPAANHVETRAHFMNLAACAMRQIICDYARKRQRLPVAGNPHTNATSTNDTEEVHAVEVQMRQFISLDEALHALARIRPRQAQVVECRFFGGMTDEEISLALDISPRTIQREWSEARAWLAENMRDD